MKIAVLGIGGVGGFYGSLLAKHYSGSTEVEIIFIVKERQLVAIKKNGLTLLADGETIITHPHQVTSDCNSIGKLDLVMVCLKSYSLINGIKQLKHIISGDTVIIPLSNGLEPYETLLESFPEAIVFQGCCYLNSHVQEPGIIKKSGTDQLFIGHPGKEKRDKILLLLKNASLNVAAKDNIQVEMWEKFIFGSALSAMCSLYNVSIGEIINDPERKKQLITLFHEAKLVSKNLTVNTDAMTEEVFLNKTASYPPEMKPSMALDFAAGKPTELETFVGYIVKKGKVLGLSLPAYNLAYDKLKQITTSKQNSPFEGGIVRGGNL